jgi:hypothetical protein
MEETRIPEGVKAMVFNTTFNNISVTCGRSVVFPQVFWFPPSIKLTATI